MKNIIPVTLLLLLLFVAACKKQRTINTSSTISPSGKFLSLPPSSPSYLQRVAQKIHQQNLSAGFLPQLEKEEGIPVWHKAQVTILESNNITADTLVLLPLVRDGARQTSGFIVCKVGMQDAEIINLVRSRYYAAYGFENNKNNITANVVALQSMLFDKKIFGDSTFELTDNRLFNSTLPKRTAGQQERAVISIRESKLSVSAREMELIPKTNTVCYTVTHKGDQGNLVGAAPGEDPNYYYTEEICVTDVVFVPTTSSFPTGGSAPLPGGAPATGSLGGSGSASSKPTTWYNGCQDGKLMLMSDGIKKTECVEFTETPAWKPLQLTLTDEEKEKRLNQLLDWLKDEPEALLPCNELSKLQIYGHMYKSVEQFLPPTSVTDELEKWENEYGIILTPTYLDKAYGPTVNADFFPIRIDKMPTINSAQGTATPESLLEYFRLNINSFINTNIAKFEPYKENGFDATGRWNEAGKNAIGAVINLNMPANNGDVVLSDYTSDIESASMTVSTIWSTLSGSHPVQGNRRWGVYTPTHGQYKVFYTMAVDRISTVSFNAGNWLKDILVTSGFEDADKLWRSLQANMVDFINANGGKASVATEIVVRTKYETIKDYLNGTITFDELKKLLGC